MAMTSAAAPSGVFYGWWVALALVIIVFLSTGIRFTIGPFLKPVSADLGIDRGTFSLVISLFDLTGGYGAAFAVAGALLLTAAGLSIAINETARPAGRVVMLTGRPHPVAGGR